MAIKVKNSAAQLENTTLLQSESDQEITGEKIYRRAPDAPFAVEPGSAVVPNLDADMLDGQHGTDFHDATQLDHGTIPGARFPAIMPAVSAAAMLAIPAPAVAGELPASAFPDPLPAKSGLNLTAMPTVLPATSLANATHVPLANGDGQIPVGGLPTVTANLLAAAKKRSIIAPIVVLPGGIGAAFSFVCWRVNVACHVKALKGRRHDGTSCSLNAYRNSSEKFVASDITTASPDTWVDGGAVQNDALAVGDTVGIMVISPVGAPTQLVVQIDIELD